MLKNTVLLAFFVLIPAAGLFANALMARINYIEQYQELAIAHHRMMGIPASIKLAQGILESQDGKSELAVNANNHFGIKCKDTWTGDTYDKEDDDYEQGKLVKSCFRVYPTAEESYFDHSRFLMNGQRYKHLFSYGKDYRKWAHGLQKAGYATAKNYAERLIRIIEQYELYQFDVVATSNYTDQKNFYPSEVETVDQGQSVEAIRSTSTYMREQTTQNNPAPTGKANPEMLILQPRFSKPTIRKMRMRW